MKKFIITLLVVLVALAIFLIVKTDKVKYDGNDTPAAEDTGGASGQFMKLGENAIVVMEQRLSDKVTMTAINMEKAGFVIIHKDAGGKPGAIIGVSKWFPSGQYANEDIGTTETLLEGVDYYAKLYVDDGNGIFDPKNDKPAVNFAGEIWGVFQASKDAADPKDSVINY